MKWQARVATSNLMLPRGFMANHFDIVSVRTNHEGRIVVCVVLGAQTRRAIVFATRAQRGPIEGVDLPAILGRKRQVKMRRSRFGYVTNAQ